MRTATDAAIEAESINVKESKSLLYMIEMRIENAIGNGKRYCEIGSVFELLPTEKKVLIEKGYNIVSINPPSEEKAGYAIKFFDKPKAEYGYRITW